MDKEQSFVIKGIREGLLVTARQGNWQEIQEELLAQIENQEAFFKGAKLALDVGEQTLRAIDLGGLIEKLLNRGITLWAVLSSSPKTEQNAQALGLATRIFTPKPEREVRSAHGQTEDGEPAIFIRRTLRSGTKITCPGSVAVLGDINPGAEVIASGNIIVWGKVRGVVHAGAEGDDQCMVCALDLQPMQLRIADIIAVTPSRKGKPQPEIARVVDGQVIAEPWMYDKGGR